MQIYRTPKGPAILVGREHRGKSREQEYHFVLAHDGIVWHRWHTTLPDEFELVYDPGSRAEADVLLAEANALIYEKKVLLECLKTALGQMDDRAAEQVRDIWRARIKTADLLSLTEGV